MRLEKPDGSTATSSSAMETSDTTSRSTHPEVEGGAARGRGSWRASEEQRATVVEVGGQGGEVGDGTVLGDTAVRWKLGHFVGAPGMVIAGESPTVLGAELKIGTVIP